MVYVYAILRSRDAARLALDVPGVDGQRPDVVCAGAIAAIIGRAVPDVPPRTADAIWAHERVIEAAMAKLTLLPARFGTQFRDEQALAGRLTRFARELEAGLDRVEGCVELGVRVIASEKPKRATKPVTAPPMAIASAGTGTGTAYMLRRLEEERRQQSAAAEAERLAGEIHQPLSQLARESARRAPGRATTSAPQPVMVAAYLVARDRVEAFRARVSSLAHGREDLRLLCTGPWPPYHFVPALAEEVSGA